MKKSIKVLEQKLDSIMVFIEDQLKHVKAIDCSKTLRFVYAVNLATNLRMLLNDENSNVSLLHLLNIKEKLRFPAIKEDVWESMAKSPSNLYYSSSHTEMTTVNGGLYYKVNDFQTAEDLVYTFDAWWNEIVIDSKAEHLSQITRRDVVLTLADKEGGAHLDANYDDAYYQAIKRGGFIFKDSKEEEVPILNDVYSETMLFIATEFLNAYKVHRNLKPYTFIKQTSPYKILQLTYFRPKVKNGKTVFEKRYRFFRYNNNHINDAIMFWFDYYQQASYRILDLYQISKRFPNGKLLYAQVIDLRSHSEQIVYARTEDCKIHVVLHKNKQGYKPIVKVEGVDCDRYVSLNEMTSQLAPEDPHAFDTYWSKQIIDEPC